MAIKRVVYHYTGGSPGTIKWTERSCLRASRAAEVRCTEVMEFARQNQKAMLLLHAATQDYAAPRCLLLNHLFVGLSIGAQAIEKYLKAAILFAEPSREVRRLGHNISELLSEAECCIPSLAHLALKDSADRFVQYYQTRYPDNSNQPLSMDTGRRDELDLFVIGVNSRLPIPRNVKFRSGLYAEITFSLGYEQTVSPNERWIKEWNSALMPLWPEIESQYPDVMGELYPNAEEAC